MIPAPSWPSTIGSRASRSPWATWTSEWHRPGVGVPDEDLALLRLVEVELLDLDPLAGLDDDCCLGLHLGTPLSVGVWTRLRGRSTYAVTANVTSATLTPPRGARLFNNWTFEPVDSRW